MCFLLLQFFLASLFVLLLLGNLFDGCLSGTWGNCVIVFRPPLPVLHCVCERQWNLLFSLHALGIIKYVILYAPGIIKYVVLFPYILHVTRKKKWRRAFELSYVNFILLFSLQSYIEFVEVQKISNTPNYCWF